MYSQVSERCCRHEMLVSNHQSKVIVELGEAKVNANGNYDDEYIAIVPAVALKHVDPLRVKKKVKIDKNSDMETFTHFIERKLEGRVRKVIMQMWPVTGEEVLPENFRLGCAVEQLQVVVADCCYQKKDVLG